MDREFDIIIYGASALSARYILKHLKNHNVTIALAGRSATRIKNNIKEEIFGQYEIFECDICNIDFITPNCKVLINCAGPYINSGFQIIESCVKNQTNYVDLTGETYFIEKVFCDYRNEDVGIVNCCGFDSVIADLGTQYFKEYIKKEKNSNKDEIDKCDEKIAKNQEIHVESILVMNNCAVNKTTYDSAILGVSKVKETRKLRKINNPTKNFVKPKKIFYNKELKGYCTIFPSADSSIVKRTQTMLRDEGDIGCTYSAYIRIGGIFTVLKTLMLSIIFYIFSKFSVGRFLLMKFPEIYTLNTIKKRRPTEEEISRGSFKMYFYSPETKTKLIISGPDPAYECTGICVSECAIMLLEKKVKGVCTPGYAFCGTDLVERLNENKIRFDVIKN